VTESEPLIDVVLSELRGARLLWTFLFKSSFPLYFQHAGAAFLVPTLPSRTHRPRTSMPTPCHLVCPASVAPLVGRGSRVNWSARVAVTSLRAVSRDDIIADVVFPESTHSKNANEPEAPSRPSVSSHSPTRAAGVSLVACIACFSIQMAGVGDVDALAGTPKGQGVLSTDEYGRSDVDRCSLEALKKGASTRAAFSDFATMQNPELYVNIERCDYSNMDLTAEVLSGVKARGADFSNSIFGPESSRADFSTANLSGTVMRSTNLFNANFAGADLTNADRGGALASGANFGKDAQTGEPATLTGTNFEDTLLSSSDVVRMCGNKTLDYEGKMNLGC